jgi:hypothetical protein
MDRKELTRQYKETPRPMGVYRIRNTVNGKWLIGTSVNVPGMLNRIRFELEAGAGKNRALQADWDESGPDAFEFETLDLLKPRAEPGYDPAEDLRLLEEMWFEKLSQSEGPGYETEADRGK